MSVLQRMTLDVGLACVCLMSLPVWADEAAFCVKTESVCTEPGGTRLINGIPVTRDCWVEQQTYACLTPDTGTDGCQTLRADAAGAVAADDMKARDEPAGGHCRRTQSACTETVTDVEGRTWCLAQRSQYTCERQIALPAVNAEWEGHETVQEPVVDASACALLAEDAACRLDQESCETGADGQQHCTRTYRCAEKRLRGCSALEAAGCRRQTHPVCDPALDEQCGVSRAEYVCEAPLPDTVVASPDIQVESSQIVNVGSPSPQAAACEAITHENPTCRQISQVCTDPSPQWRVINGKRYFRTCWAYERTFACTDTEPQTTCQALDQAANCQRESQRCEQTDDKGCTHATAIYRCTGAAGETPTGEATLIDASDTVTGRVEVGNCAALEADDSCRLETSVCTRPSGLDAADPACEERSLSFVCKRASGGGQMQDACRPYADDQNCRETSSVCLATDADGTCTLRTKTYTCAGQSQDVAVGEVCDGALCIGGLCEPVQGAASTDFAEGVAVMEIARQAGVYGDVATDSIFAGTRSTCRVKAGGFSCCRPANTEGAGMSNAGLGVAAVVGAQAVGETIKYVGSPYVYDLLSQHESTTWLLNALYGKAGSGVYSPHLSYYGVSVTASGTGSLTLEFSPASFFAAVALEMAQDYLSCTQSEQLHAMRRGKGLCHYVGSRCQKKAGGTCLLKQESWVCFNSKMALIVQEQGRAQLGIGWGTPEAPLTRGLTLAEFQKLDFSRMDLTGVIADIAAQNADKLEHGVSGQGGVDRAHARVQSVTANPQNQYRPIESITAKRAQGRQ